MHRNRTDLCRRISEDERGGRRGVRRRDAHTWVQQQASNEPQHRIPTPRVVLRSPGANPRDTHRISTTPTHRRDNILLPTERRQARSEPFSPLLERECRRRPLRGAPCHFLTVLGAALPPGGDGQDSSPRCDSSRTDGAVPPTGVSGQKNIGVKLSTITKPTYQPPMTAREPLPSPLDRTWTDRYRRRGGEKEGRGTGRLGQ